MTTDQDATDAPVADLTASVEAPRDFSAFLLDLNKGRTHEELSQHVHDVVAGVLEHGKAGEITLKLKLAPRSDADGQVLVSDEVSAKVPTANRKPTAFFTSRNGDLVRDDPQQFGMNGHGMPPSRDR